MGLRLDRAVSSGPGVGLGWGPIDGVARAIAMWRRAGASCRGPWGLIAAKDYRDLWPSELPPLPEFAPVDAPLPERWLRRAIRLILRRIGIELRRRVPERRPLPRMLPLTVDAQEWLGK